MNDQIEAGKDYKQPEFNGHMPTPTKPYTAYSQNDLNRLVQSVAGNKMKEWRNGVQAGMDKKGEHRQMPDYEVDLEPRKRYLRTISQLRNQNREQGDVTGFNQFSTSNENAVDLQVPMVRKLPPQSATIPGPVRSSFSTVDASNNVPTSIPRPMKGVHHFGKVKPAGDRRKALRKQMGM